MPHDAAGDGGGGWIITFEKQLGLARATAEAGVGEAEPVGHGGAGDLVGVVETGEGVGEVVHLLAGQPRRERRGEMELGDLDMMRRC